MGISRELMKKLLHLLRPYMKNEMERSACLMRALGNDAPVLYRLVWDTPANVFIPNMVNELITFGEITPGEPALIALLKVIYEDVGEDVKASIDDLLEEIKLNLKKQSSIKADDFNKQKLSSVIYAPVHNLDIYILNLAVEAAKAVVRVGTSQAAGTGFMIASDLLMTNNHIIRTQEEAKQSEYIFNYQLDINRKECSTHTAQGQPESVFHTNAELDYTVFCIKEVPDFYSPLKLKGKSINRNDHLAIIQHPGGSVKKISMQNTFVEYADDKVVQYTKTTLPGSAGSPVFDNEFKVIAIHHSGGNLLEPGTNKRYLRSQGTSAIALLNDLKNNAPEIYARLQR